jgi:hypothetical protein
MSKIKIFLTNIDISTSGIVLLIIIAVTIPATIYFHSKDSTLTRLGKEKIKKLNTIKAEQIANIRICRNYSCSDFFQNNKINTAASKQLFALAVNKLETYQSNHDSPQEKYYIRMIDVNGELFEFDVYLKDKSDKTVYLNIVKQNKSKSNMYLENLGGWKSQPLYKWLNYLKIAN